ncbi:MarR family winged helix-turn-helix transcriptional regulator [Pleomorphomonas sp. PLEO]|uniref:MarR family winged helix-turn-helix transcriptional regulator n=1 Tax=Pleomorphomonas sp. PLEO TaxID=3239306 RepID=UPI00351F456F
MDPLENYFGARNALTASEDQLKARADEHGLTVIEFIILAMVGRGRDRSGIIATETGYNPTTVSHNISDLEDRDLLKRERVEGDARGFKLCLTEAGRAIVATIPESF